LAFDGSRALLTMGGSERSTDGVGFAFDSVHSGVMWVGLGFACRGGLYRGEEAEGVHLFPLVVGAENL
jgi:hypothetical protein